MPKIEDMSEEDIVAFLKKRKQKDKPAMQEMRRTWAAEAQAKGWEIGQVYLSNNEGPQAKQYRLSDGSVYDYRGTGAFDNAEIKALTPAERKKRLVKAEDQGSKGARAKAAA